MLFGVSLLLLGNTDGVKLHFLSSTLLELSFCWVMMKTRRKSKAAAAAAADSENEPGSPAAEDGQRLTVYIPSDIDLDTLSNLLPETSITSQSPEGIIELYRRLVDLASKLDATVRERDDDRADAERMEVELDQALQDKEALS
jgi:nucleoprotein TPR